MSVGMENPLAVYANLPGSSEYYPMNTDKKNGRRGSHPHQRNPTQTAEQLVNRFNSTRKRFSSLFHLGHPSSSSTNPTSTPSSSHPHRQSSPPVSHQRQSFHDSSEQHHGSLHQHHSQHRSHHHRSNGSREDLLATLSRYDTVFLVDDSASMSTHGRWHEAGAALSAVVSTAVRYDPDGIDIYFLNTTAHLRNARSAQDVENLFRHVQPTGPSTPIEVRLEALTSLYLDQLEYAKSQGLPPMKPMNLIVITDGATDDPETLIYSIATVANRLDEGRFPSSQLGIQFIQIGHDREATELLRKLDSDLKHNYSVKRDIVDTTLYQNRLSGDFILKCLLGGINRRIDGDRSHR